MTKAILAVALCGLLTASLSVASQEVQTPSTTAVPSTMELGVGAKFVNGLPVAILNLKGEHFGVEAGLAFRFLNVERYVNVSIISYSGLAKWYFPLEEFPLAPFLGAGLVGNTVTASAGGLAVSAGFLELDFVAGLEISGKGFGVPLTLFVGPEYRYLFSAWGLSSDDIVDMALLAGALGWQIGLRYQF